MSVTRLHTKRRNHISNGTLLIAIGIKTSEHFTLTSRCIYIYYILLFNDALNIGTTQSSSQGAHLMNVEQLVQ
jgi:hypothetical protein